MFTHFRKRPPLFITAALTLCVAVCYYAGSEYYRACAVILIAVMAAFTAMLLFSLRGEHYSLIVMALMVLLFSVFGIFSVGQRMKAEANAKRYVESVITAEGTVHKAVAENDGDNYRVLLKAEKIYGKKVKEPFYIEFFTDVDGPMARLYDKAEFRIFITDTAKEIYNDSHRDNLRSEGIFLTGYGAYDRTTDTRNAFDGIIRKSVEFIDDKLEFLVCRTFARALITGDRSYLDEQIKSDFSRAGVSHVLALSGLHISIILLSVHSFFNMLTAHRRIYTAFATLLLLFYMLMTGFSHSVVRASIMAVIVMVSSLLSGEYDALNSLSIALLVILVVDPYAVGSVSLQLSFTATLGIVVLGAPCIKKIKDYFYKKLLYKVHFVLFRWGLRILLFVVSSIIITISVTIFTFPAIAVHYASINIRAFISNMIIIPQISLMITVLLIYVAVCALPFVGVKGYIAMAEYIDVQGMIVCKCAKALAELPLADLHISPDIRSIVAISTVTLLGLLVLCDARKRRYVLIVITALAIGISHGVYELMVPVHQIHCISIDNSECVIFRNASSVSVYKARGDSSYAVKEFCEEYDFDRLDSVIAPVADSELERYLDVIYDMGYSVENVVCYATRRDEKDFENYLNSHGTELKLLDYGDEFVRDNMKFCVKSRSDNSYFVKYVSDDKGFVYSTNLIKAKYPEPIDISDADIVVLNGERETFEYGFEKEAEYFLFDHSKYSSEFMNYVKDMNIYDTADADVYIFTLGGNKVSMRSKAYGVQ